VTQPRIVFSLVGGTVNMSTRLYVDAFKVTPLAGYPVIYGQPENQKVKVGDDVNFKVVADGPQPLEYRWRFNGYDMAGEGAAHPYFRFSNVQRPSAGTYSVRITNPFGSVMSSNAVLTVE
jgi:hypothetical protein